MNSNELLSYLHDVRDLEQIYYTCNTGINNLQYKANRLGIYKKIKLPEKKEFDFFYSWDFELGNAYAISFFIGIIIPIIYCIQEKEHWQGSILGIIAAIILVFVGGAIIALPIIVVIYIGDYIYILKNGILRDT